MFQGEHSAILLTFIKLPVFIKIFDLSIFEWPFYTGFTVCHYVNRGSNMRAHVLLNLLNKLGKRDKMRGLPSILSLFLNKFNKFNNTRARM